MSVTNERPLLPIAALTLPSTASAVVTVDSKLPAVVPAADLARAIEVAKASKAALVKASYGKGDFVKDTLLQKAVTISDKLVPKTYGTVEYRFATLIYGVGGASAGFAAMAVACGGGIITPFSLAVGAATALATASIPMWHAVLRKVGKIHEASAADKLIAPDAPKPLERIAATGNATDIVLAGLEAKRWLSSGNAAHALSPDARFALEDLIEAQAEVDPGLNNRTVKLAQLADLVVSTPKVTPSTVRDVAAILEAFDASEQKDLRRAVIRTMSERKGDAITYEGRHALADLSRPERTAAATS